MEDKTNQDHVTNPFYISCICKIRPDELTCHIGGNTINNLIPLVSEGGCGVMPAISPNEFGRALCLIPEGSQFMGLARVGAFHTHNTPSMGYVKSELYRMNPDTVFLSVGRNGYLLERPVTKSQINRLKLKAV